MSHLENASTSSEFGQYVAQRNDVSDLKLQTTKHAYSELGQRQSLR